MRFRNALGCLLLCAAALTAQPSRFVFAIVTDPQLGMKEAAADREQFARLVGTLNGLKDDSRPAFVLLGGDMVNDEKSEAQWTAYQDILNTLRYPTYWTPGNHDPHPKAPARFSFVHEGCLFLGLDSNLWRGEAAAAAEQFAWLEGQLKDRGKYHLVFVLQHHPLFLHDAAEKDEYFNTPPVWRAKLLTLFEAARVTAVLGGHLHRNTSGWHRGISLMVTPSALNNFDGTPAGFRLVEVTGKGFQETYLPVAASR
jgi:3',5'-cyclic AMP phosphodiesterase CpdA